MKEKYQCVYFFKPERVNAIKVGSSLFPEPSNDFHEFKKHYPFGANLLGFIQCLDSEILKNDICDRIATKHIKNDFFNVSLSDVDDIISEFAIDNQLRLRSQFEESFSYFIGRKNSEPKNELIKEAYKTLKGKVRITDLAKQFGVTRQYVYALIKEIEQN